MQQRAATDDAEPGLRPHRYCLLQMLRGLCGCGHFCTQQSRPNQYEHRAGHRFQIWLAGARRGRKPPWCIGNDDWRRAGAADLFAGDYTLHPVRHGCVRDYSGRSSAPCPAGQTDPACTSGGVLHVGRSPTQRGQHGAFGCGGTGD